ncbi:hypothetical protein SASPL_114782 [Salvia splendens]|uniref:Uncharacterized protein n=1 Tax=Salvia splendens TaxID=180675 RepID=A0A8X8Y198_SALSN|nr:hypothetical protein SASPL_114782 [Salvia splendens]
MLSSQRLITKVQAHEIDLVDDVGLNQKSSFNLMSRQAGGRDGIGYKEAWCMYGFEDETKFEEAWSNLLTQCNLLDSMWLKHMYSVKAKWAYLIDQSLELVVQSCFLVIKSS